MVTWLNKLQARIGLLKDVVVGVHLRKNYKESLMILGLLESNSATIRTLPRSFLKLDPTTFDRGSPPITIIVSNYAAAVERRSAYKKLHIHFFLNRQDLVAHTDKLLAAKSSLKRPLDNSVDTKTTKKLKPEPIIPQLQTAQRGTESDPMCVDDDEVVDSSPTFPRTLPSSASSIPSSSALNVSSSLSSSNPATTVQKQPTAISSDIAAPCPDRDTVVHSPPAAPGALFCHSANTSSSPSTTASTSSSTSGITTGAVPGASSSPSAGTTRTKPLARNAFASFFAKKPAPFDNSPFGSGMSVASSSSSTRSLPSEQSTIRAVPQLHPHGQQQPLANVTVFTSGPNWILPPPIAPDQLPEYVEFSANGPVLRLAFEVTGFGEGAHLLSEWATYDGWTHPAECIAMAKEILSRDLDGFCHDLDDAVRAIIEQGLFVDGLTLFRKAITHSEGKDTLTIPVNFHIPLSSSATYIRLFYLRPSDVAGLQTHLTNTAPKMSTRIAGVIQDGARFEWNGSTWVLYRYTGTTERWVLERVAEVGDQCHVNVWEGARKDEVVHRTVVAVVSTAGPRPVSLAARLMAELVLLVKLGPRNRINAIDQPQRPVYAIPRELLEAWPKFTRNHPELWAHLPNCLFFNPE